MTPSQLKGAMLGLAVGDALGVPVEFMSRSFLKRKPVTDMQGYGTHDQPAGTWSDDSSLAFCLAEALVDGFSCKKLSEKILAWYSEAYWTPYGQIFDMGVATRNACERLLLGLEPETCGEHGDYSNGNGSLMRILPLVFILNDKSIDQRFDLVRRTSSLTHSHVRSVVACFFYVEFLLNLMSFKKFHPENLEKAKFKAYAKTQNDIRDYLIHREIPEEEREIFVRLLFDNITELPEDEIFSSGYVVHTLEASVWAFLTTNSYKEAVCKAVNLGDDTDTSGSVTGGMAGLFYGSEAIPQLWIESIARKEDILDLVNRMNTILDS